MFPVSSNLAATPENADYSLLSVFLDEKRIGDLDPSLPPAPPSDFFSTIPKDASDDMPTTTMAIPVIPPCSRRREGKDTSNEEKPRKKPRLTGPEQDEIPNLSVSTSGKTDSNYVSRQEFDKFRQDSKQFRQAMTTQVAQLQQRLLIAESRTYRVATNLQTNTLHNPVPTNTNAPQQQIQIPEATNSIHRKIPNLNKTDLNLVPDEVLKPRKDGLHTALVQALTTNKPLIYLANDKGRAWRQFIVQRVPELARAAKCQIIPIHITEPSDIEEGFNFAINLVFLEKEPSSKPLAGLKLMQARHDATARNIEWLDSRGTLPTVDTDDWPWIDMLRMYSVRLNKQTYHILSNSNPEPSDRGAWSTKMREILGKEFPSLFPNEIQMTADGKYFYSNNDVKNALIEHATCKLVGKKALITFCTKPINDLHFRARLCFRERSTKEQVDVEYEKPVNSSKQATNAPSVIHTSVNGSSTNSQIANLFGSNSAHSHAFPNSFGNHAHEISLAPLNHSLSSADHQPSGQFLLSSITNPDGLQISLQPRQLQTASTPYPYSQSQMLLQSKTSMAMNSHLVANTNQPQNVMDQPRQWNITQPHDAYRQPQAAAHPHYVHPQSQVLPQSNVSAAMNSQFVTHTSQPQTAAHPHYVHTPFQGWPQPSAPTAMSSQLSLTSPQARFSSNGHSFFKPFEANNNAQLPACALTVNQPGAYPDEEDSVSQTYY